MRDLRRVSILGSCVAVMAALTACASPSGPVTGPTSATAAAAATTIEVTAVKEGDRVDVQVVDGTATLDIASATGIGAAALEVVSGPYPTAVVFQLHLKGLEQFTLTYGTVTIHVAVAHDGSSQARQAMIQGGDEQPLTPASPYWMPVEVTTVSEDSDKTGQPERIYALSAPPDFLQTQPRTFTINWIDFFR